MKLHTLSEFSKTVMRQTEQPVSYFFWSWLGGCILWMLCRIAFCYAVQISFTFLELLPALEATWYGLRLMFAVGGFIWLTPLLYRCLYTCAAAASLTKQLAPEKGGSVSQHCVCEDAAVGLAAVATVPVEFALVLRAGNNGFGWRVVAVDRDAVSYIGSAIFGWLAVAVASLSGCPHLASVVSRKSLLEFGV